MQNDFNIHVLTSDRDLGDSQAYPNVNVNRWSHFDRTSLLLLQSAISSLFFDRFDA